jgi:hypothetical protein
MPGSNDETLPMSFAERVFRLLGAAVLAAYSGYALIHSEVILPTKRGSLHLHGVAGGLVVGSLLCAVVYLLVPVISRSSHIWGFQRARFTLWSKRAGWFLFGAGNGLSIAGFDNPASAVPMPLSVILGAGLFVGVAMIGWLPDRFPAARAITSSVTPKPVTNAARVTGLVLMLLALPVALIAVPGMVQMRLGAFVAASAAIVMLAVGGYVFRSKPLDPAPVRSAYRSKWLPVRIALILVVGIWAIWYTSIRQLGRTVEQDDVEYQAARSWPYDVNDFFGGIPQQAIEARLKAEGHRMHCYTNLRREEKIDPTDTHVCWTFVKEIAGIPARSVTFHFGTDGLRHIVQDFPREQWPAVSAWFQQLSGEPAGTFGRDQGGGQILGRRVATGLMMTSDPHLLKWTMVTWDARSYYRANACVPRSGLTADQRRLLCDDWPAPPVRGPFAPI